MIFLSVGFYVKSILDDLEVLHTAVCVILGALNFVNLANSEPLNVLNWQI